MAKTKAQRVRDPVHNLIEFSHDHFEQALWKVIQTEPYQRLRRIRQLGFSEFVFPGATHSRFAHSLGVFHVARQLMSVVKRFTESTAQSYNASHAQHALAAALLHDVGHGMFSHAFEALGREFHWPMARHEDVSQKIIREDEIAEILDFEFGSGFSGNVADVIARSVPNNLYGSVVSSQFDADRLDYMQRDRLMTGVQSSGVDTTWLLANLEIGEVETGIDETRTGIIETLVLGPKAMQAAESYVLSLFHLYPNVYLHKTTRGLELLFQATIRRLNFLVAAGLSEQSGLPSNHPIIQFLIDPQSLKKALSLDDTVFWGALPMLRYADDRETSRLAKAIANRNVFKCIDIKSFVEEEIDERPNESPNKRKARIKITCDNIIAELKDRFACTGDQPCTVLVDQYLRSPYKRYQESRTPLNQIQIRIGDGKLVDMAVLSPVVANAEPFALSRAYISRDDPSTSDAVRNIMRTKIQESKDASP